jgi:type II secretory pathway component PulC
MADDKAPGRSVCFIRCLGSGERHGALGVGDVACNVAEIIEIRDTAVIIRNVAANRLEWLAFPPDFKRATSRQATGGALPVPASSAQPREAEQQAASATSTPTATTVEVPRATVEKYLANLSDLLASALAVPHYSESATGQKTMDGFTISRIKEGGAAEQVGLRDGDVVQEINGQPLDDMSAVMALFGRLPTMTQAKVRLLRAGKPMTIIVNVK